MKPPAFEYVRPASLEEALGLLEQSGAKLLAGGQSLLPLLNLRLARPSLLVDVGRLPGLDHIYVDNQGQLHLGALVRHQRLLLDDTVARRAPLLVQAVELVGHIAIRNRGTLGGSLAHADPTAELGTALVALGARFRLASRSAERWIEAQDFFEGPFETVARADEMLLEVAVPARPPGEGSSYLELSQRLGDFAIVAVAALTRTEAGRLTGVRIVWSGAAGRPQLADGLAGRLEGIGLDEGQLELLCQQAVVHLQPTSDIRGSSEYKRAALAELSSRALRSAARDAEERGR